MGNVETQGIREELRETLEGEELELAAPAEPRTRSPATISPPQNYNSRRASGPAER